MLCDGLSELVGGFNTGLGLSSWGSGTWGEEENEGSF